MAHSSCTSSAWSNTSHVIVSHSSNNQGYFEIFNDGDDVLLVETLNFQNSSTWLALSESPSVQSPLSIDVGSSVKVYVTIAKTGLATGNHQEIIHVISNDEDNPDVTVTVNLNIVDTTPPSAPSNVTVQPSSWTQSNSFTVDWNNPPDESAIVGGYYKFNSPPTSNADGTYFDIQAKPLNIQTPSGGETALYIWLKDSQGNVNYQQNASTFLYQDSTVPFTVNASPADNDVDVPIDVSISVSLRDLFSGVDQSSIIMKVNSIQVTPSIQGTANDFNLTYTPLASFGFSEIITVSIDASDLSSPANIMPQAVWTFTTKCQIQTFYYDNDEDTYGNPDEFKRACSTPDGYVTNNTDCNDDPENNGSLQYPGNAENCDNLDNDCDNHTDEDINGNPLTQQCGINDIGVCEYGMQTCSDGSYGDCIGVVLPGVEICDGLDNDCNGKVDELLCMAGDIDSNDTIDIDDVFCLFKHIMGRPSCLDSVNVPSALFCNIDGIGDVDIDDVYCLFKKIMGRPSCLDFVPNWNNVHEEPFNIYPSINVINPVLTANDITDVEAEFVADPFLFNENDIWYMFFEVLNITKGRGEIGLATSSDGLIWTYDQIVLTEPTSHLSFPYVFKYSDNYYMIPETGELEEVRLYKSYDFPYDWKYEETLITGKNFVDTSVIFFNGTWWMFASEYDPNTRLYYSDTLVSQDWIEHPQNPIISGDASKSRGAGRTIVFGENRIIRLAQKGNVTYGEKVRAFEIDILSTTEYAEHEIEESPILISGHHVDPWWTGNKWLCAVDKQTVQYRVDDTVKNFDDWSIWIYSSIDVPPIPPIPQTEWELVHVDSEEKNINDAIYAFDGDIKTFWHTVWSETSENYSLTHEIQIDLGKFYDVEWFLYLPRQDEGTNGRIGKYKFYVSDNVTEWGDPVASGTFANNSFEKVVSFAPEKGRYIRLQALTEANNLQFTSMAEIRVMGNVSQ